MEHRDFTFAQGKIYLIWGSNSMLVKNINSPIWTKALSSMLAFQIAIFTNAAKAAPTNINCRFGISKIKELFNHNKYKQDGK